MKDKQLAPVDPGLGLFLFSVTLHCASMTVLVYLRYSFGYAFLRPKSFFLACAWAFGLYALYAWIDQAAWQHRRALILFGGGSIALYCLHLIIALVREWRGGGEHDRYGGTSWIDKLAGTVGLPSVFTGDALHLWVEPTVVVAAALGARSLFGARTLAGWLSLAGGCLWAKAALNHWLYVRQRKRQKDSLADAEDSAGALSSPEAPTGSLGATRKAGRKRARVIQNRN